MCSFGLTSVAESPKNFAKLRTIFQTTKFFLNFFSSFFRRPTRVRGLACQDFNLAETRAYLPGGTSVPKASAKLGTFFHSTKFFSKNFMLKKHSFTKYPPQSPMYQ